MTKHLPPVSTCTARRTFVTTIIRRFLKNLRNSHKFAPEWPKRAHVLTLALVTLACSLVSCIGVVPMREKNRIPNVEAQHPLDFRFLQSGVTTRAQVAEKLKDLQIETGDPQLFWARWSRSRAAWFAAVGGGYNAAVGGERIWRPANLLIEFDDNGIVANTPQPLSDKQLVAEMKRMIMQRPTQLDFQQGIDIDGWQHKVRRSRTLHMRLEEQEAVITEQGATREKTTEFLVPRTAFLTADGTTLGGDPAQISVTVHFAARTPLGQKISLLINPKDLYVLLSYARIPQPRDEGGK